MAAGENIIARIDRLVALFNARSMDLPDGLFTRQTRLLLNGVAFEAMLGRSPDDPLVLMLTRGPAGYRFTAKALQHAVPDALLQRCELHESQEDGIDVVRGRCRLSGHTRGDQTPVDILVDVELRIENGVVHSANATVDTTHIDRLHAARLRA
jgi:hypothetical protein